MASRALATAFVNIVPGTKELDNYLKNELPGDAEKAGGPAGERMGKSTGDGFGTKFKSVLGPIAATMAATFSVVAIGSFFKDGVSGANELNNSLAEVVSLTGTTGAAAASNMGEFKTLVQGVSQEFGIAQDVLTNGLYSALSAGVPKENALEFMRVASQAAIAGVTDVNTAVDGISTTINAFGLSAAEAQAVADSMFTAVKGGKTTFEELSGALANVAPAAAASGVSFQEVNAAIATLTAGGTQTTVATTQIRAALVGLQKPSEDMNKIFNDLGYESAQAAIEQEGLSFAMGAVSDAAAGDNGKLQQLLGSTEAVAAVQVLAGTGAGKFAAELEAQATAAGASQDALDVIDPQRALEKLNIAFESMKLSVGDALLPVFAGLAETLTPLVYELAPVLASTMEGLAPILSNIVGILPTLIAAFLPILPVFGELIGALLSILADAILPAFISILLAIIPTIVDLLPLFTQLLTDVILPLIPQVLALVEALLPLVIEVFEALLPLLPVILPALIELLQSILMPLVPIVLQLVEAFLPIVEMIFPILIGLLTNFVIPIITTLAEIFSGLLTVAIGIVIVALGFFSDAVDNTATFFQEAWEGVGNFFKGFVNGLIGLFEGFVNGAIDGINLLIGALNTIQLDIPATPFSDGFTLGVNLPLVRKINIPRLADGGYVDSPTTALIGEAGPEVVTPLKDFERMMGIGEGNGKTIIYNAAPNQSIDSEQALFQAMRRAKVVAAW